MIEVFLSYVCLVITNIYLFTGVVSSQKGKVMGDPLQDNMGSLNNAA